MAHLPFCPLPFPVPHKFTPQDITKLDRIGEDIHTVVWHADKGMVFRTFDNVLLVPRLRELGLQRETAFACLFDFLYHPTEAAVQAVHPQLEALLADPRALKIGMQIRIGDWQLINPAEQTFHPQVGSRRGVEGKRKEDARKGEEGEEGAGLWNEGRCLSEGGVHGRYERMVPTCVSRLFPPRHYLGCCLSRPQHHPWLFRHFIDCAIEIEHELAAEGQTVVW